LTVALKTPINRVVPPYFHNTEITPISNIRRLFVLAIKISFTKIIMSFLFNFFEFIDSVLVRDSGNSENYRSLMGMFMNLSGSEVHEVRSHYKKY